MASRYYESEITRLLREVVEENPEVEKSQREGRDIFWDRKVDFDAQERQRRSEVPMKGYVYDAEPPLPGESGPPWWAEATRQASERSPGRRR
jgi:hypothetical protein